MLHRVLASLLCVLGAAALALGIASATAWRADDVLVADAVAADGTTMIVTEPGVLDLAADQVTVTATVPRGDVVVALGRSGDVDAWVGTDAHTRVTGLSAWHHLATNRMTPATQPPASPNDRQLAPARHDARAYKRRWNRCGMLPSPKDASHPGATPRRSQHAAATGAVARPKRRGPRRNRKRK